MELDFNLRFPQYCIHIKPFSSYLIVSVPLADIRLGSVQTHPLRVVMPVVPRRHVLQVAILRSLIIHLRMHTYLVTSPRACLPRPRLTPI